MLTTCCPCLDLRRGCLAIGVTYVIVSILSLTVSIVFLALGPEMLLLPLLRSGIDFATLATFIWALRFILWVMVIISVLMLVINALLIRGVQVGNECLVLFWLVANGILLVLTSIGYLYQLITAISGGAAAAIVLALLTAVWAGLQWYWYVVVLSFYRALAAGDEQVKPPLSVERGSSRVEPLQQRITSVSDSLGP